MRIRTEGEQKAYLDGFERCAECIKSYLSGYGKKTLECQLMAVRNAVEIEDVTKSEYDHDHDVMKAYNDGQAFILDMLRKEIEQIQVNRGDEFTVKQILEIIDKYKEGFILPLT